MKYSLGENLANSKVKSHYELYIQLGNFKNIDIRYSGQTTDSTESSYISSNLSFQELKRAKREITYYLNIQKNESKRKSILGSNSSIGRNSSKRFSLYSLYKSESKRSSSFYSYGSLPRSPLRTKEDE
ncbi:hypothetical protein BCR32DRAFT_288233, partial [Anaeromyces robustus]